MPRSEPLCPAGAEALERAGYTSAARSLREWQPWSNEPARARDQRRGALSGFLSFAEGALACAEKHAPDEVEALSAAYDALERELDALDREVARAS